MLEKTGQHKVWCTKQIKTSIRTYTINRMLKLIFLVLILYTILSFSMIQYAKTQVSGKPLLIINKGISSDKFSWSEFAEIRVLVKNEGNATARNVSIIAFYPPVFDVLNNQGLSKNETTITSALIPTLNPGESHSMVYSVTGKKGVDGPLEVVLLPAQVSFSDALGTSYLKKSDPLRIAIQANSPILFYELVALILISAAFGTLGALVHWLNMSKKETETIEKRSAGRHILLGAIAGIIVLGTVEVTTKLLANSELILAVQNIIFLIATCTAAGFTPLEVISRVTQQWREKADEEEKKANEASEEALRLSLGAQDIKNLDTDKKNALEKWTKSYQDLMSNYNKLAADHESSNKIIVKLQESIRNWQLEYKKKNGQTH
jgi:hypothetical protein